METDLAAPVFLKLALSTLLGSSCAALGADWYVWCETDAGQVTVSKLTVGQQAVRMAGAFPGERTAGIWMEENCPDRQCNKQGLCQSSSPDTSPGGGWVAGELKSEALSVDPGSASTVPQTEPGSLPDGPQGPGAADLSPLINNASAAARGCNYPVALVSADHMTNFDSGHPWLVANYERLRGLARRQQNTEQLVWQASAELGEGELKHARKLASSASHIALSCQTEAVSQLVDGIDTAIEQQRREQNAARSRMASALLPSLVDLARVISGGTASGTGTPIGTGSYTSIPAASLNMGDPCAFKYEYRNKWNFEPACTCASYRFDPRTHRCTSY